MSNSNHPNGNWSNDGTSPSSVNISLPSPPSPRRVSESSSSLVKAKLFSAESSSPSSVVQGPSPAKSQPCSPCSTDANHRQQNILPLVRSTNSPSSQMHLPPQQKLLHAQDGYYFILATVQRSHSGAPWGLSIHQISPGVYAISSVAKSDALVRGYCEAASTKVHPVRFLYKNRQPVNVWTRALLSEQPPRAASMVPTPVTSILRPGDVILSVAGHPAGEFSTLASWCQWLRSTRASELWIVVRCSEAHAREWPVRCKPAIPPKSVPPPVLEPFNKAFQDPNGNFIRFDSQSPDPDEGSRGALFLAPISDVPAWLDSRKRSWRQVYTVRSLKVCEDDQEEREEDIHISTDFWTAQGFSSIHDWLSTRSKHWHSKYSWNRQKRQRLEQDCQDTRVSFDDDRQAWLRVRKNQWRVQRRKRQRERGESIPSAGIEAVIVDGLLEAQEEERKAWESRPPLDISFMFDATLGCPDDVVHRIVSFLATPDHACLLKINRATRIAFQGRQLLWKMMCHGTWKLPRRPRKKWHQIYWAKLEVETERRSKKWDDLVTKGSKLLFQGDNLSVLEKMVSEAETECDFDVNYVSSVVCERNSLLNLAVIHKRHRVVRWLVEVKSADIESYDRGSFTPLINAAWAGDKSMVRFLMQHGASRAKLGTFHYTKPLAPSDFLGLKAEEWAAKRGHHECAELLRLGL